jgi:hypothetical protein
MAVVELSNFVQVSQTRLAVRNHALDAMGYPAESTMSEKSPCRRMTTLVNGPPKGTVRRWH